MKGGGGSREGGSRREREGREKERGKEGGREGREKEGGKPETPLNLIAVTVDSNHLLYSNFTSYHLNLCILM